MISRSFSGFQIFQTFKKLEIDLGNNLDKYFELSILPELRYFFVKLLTHYKTDLKHAVTMPLHRDIIGHVSIKV